MYVTQSKTYRDKLAPSNYSITIYIGYVSFGFESLSLFFFGNYIQDWYFKHSTNFEHVNQKWRYAISFEINLWTDIKVFKIEYKFEF